MKSYSIFFPRWYKDIKVPNNKGLEGTLLQINPGPAWARPGLGPGPAWARARLWPRIVLGNLSKNDWTRNPERNRQFTEKRLDKESRKEYAFYDENAWTRNESRKE